MSPSSQLKPNPFAPIIDVLRSSLGDEAANTIVLREAQAAGLAGVQSKEEALLLLRRIESLGGTAGLAARLAIGRLTRGVPLWSLAHGQSVSSQPPIRPASDRPAQALTEAHVVALLARALGDEKAAEAVQKALADLRISGHSLAKPDVVRLLDHLVSKGGGVGTVARFAKVRFMLER